MGITLSFKKILFISFVFFAFSFFLPTNINAQNDGGGCPCGYDGAGTLCWECPADPACTSNAQCGGSDICCQGQCVGAGQCGGGGNACRNATVNCPTGSSIATNQPLYNVCQIDWGGPFCSPIGSAQLPTGCCVASGQNGCGNTQYTTYACCPANSADTRIVGSNYTRFNYYNQQTLCNDSNDQFISFVENPATGIFATWCAEENPNTGNCRAGQLYNVYNGYTTCTEVHYECVSTCTPTAPSAPVPTSPIDGSVITGTSVDLTWTQGSWGTGCPTNTNSFNLYIGSSPSTLALAGNISNPNTTSNQFNGTAGSNYCWRIDSSNGSLTSQSSVNCFTFGIATPWWQVKDGDVTTNGNLSSVVPSTNLFNTVGLGGFPGVPVYGGTFNLSSDNALISATMWNANTQIIQSRLFNYSYFENLIPDDVNLNDVSTLTSGGVPYTDDYEWYMATGDVSTSGDINIGNRKVILFVENGNLNINGKINVTDGVGFFGAFVEGNIAVDGAVTGSPSLEGVYLANGSFSSGTGAVQLHVRGSVSSFAGTSLGRDLSNNASPAELFEFAPDQMLLFPEKLMFRRSKWSEVAP